MYLAQGYITATCVRIEPRPLAPESDALTTRPPRLPRLKVDYPFESLYLEKHTLPYSNFGFKCVVIYF